MTRTTYLLLGVLLALGGTIYAADIPYAGLPAAKDGALWARKNGTTNTKQDLTSTSNALDVNIASGSQTPPTGASATQVQGTAATDAVAVGNPVYGGGRAGNVAPTNVSASGDAVPFWLTLAGAEVVAGFDGTNPQPIKTDTGGNTQSVGTAATDAPVSGAPLQNGGRGSSTLPTAVSASGDAVPLWLTLSGAQVVSVFDGTNPQTMRGDTLGTWVEGNVASDIPVTSNPLLAGGRASAAQPSNVSADGDAVPVWLSRAGVVVSTNLGINNIGDGQATVASLRMDSAVGAVGGTLVMGYSGSGTTADRLRTASAGNAIAATGVLAASPYGEYLTLANQPALTTGQYGSLQTDSALNLKTVPGAPAIGNILVGRQTFTSTTGATTLITITAGKTWVGTLGASVSCAEAAAATVSCQANATFTTVGANTTPAAGTYFVCDAKSGANAATGVVGSQGNNFCSMPFIASCASGTCTIAVASTNAGTSSLVEGYASGVMQ